VRSVRSPPTRHLSFFSFRSIGTPGPRCCDDRSAVFHFLANFSRANRGVGMSVRHWRCRASGLADLHQPAGSTIMKVGDWSRHASSGGRLVVWGAGATST
jgi:hypothetical protein